MPTGKKESYAKEVRDLLSGYLRTADDGKTREYLARNSSLPGPRGNLELAHAFADEVGTLSGTEPGKMWELASSLSSLSPDEAPVNDPKELIPFCGAVAIGAIGSMQEGYEQKALARLREKAEDPRWRTREGVAMGLQRIIGKRGSRIVKELDGWIAEDRWLVMRAAAAGVAEPALLKDPNTAAEALEIHRKIVARMLASDHRRSEGFRTLRQALGYSLSVAVCACPEEGFGYLRELVGADDPDVRWIVKENLKKNRLLRGFPGETGALKALI